MVRDTVHTAVCDTLQCYCLSSVGSLVCVCVCVCACVSVLKRRGVCVRVCGDKTEKFHCCELNMRKR